VTALWCEHGLTVQNVFPGDNFPQRKLIIPRHRAARMSIYDPLPSNGRLSPD
jgi:hypothetical protein